MSTPGSTFDFTVTRDKLITLAFIEVNLLEMGGTLEPERLAWGTDRLNIILKRLEAEKKHIWTIGPTPSTLTLVGDTFTYTSSNGLPTNIKRLVSVEYRDASGTDASVTIVRTEDFVKIRDKFQIGPPRTVYLSEHRDVGSQTLYVWPSLSSVNTASEVTGEGDSLNYTCIRSHQAADLNRPNNGADHLLYWEQTGSGASAWVTGTNYVAAQHLRLWFERPLFDFNSATDNPDVPQEWIEVLLFELSQACLNPAGVDLEERLYFQRVKEDVRMRIHPSQVPTTTNKNNKSKYF